MDFLSLAFDPLPSDCTQTHTHTLIHKHNMYKEHSLSLSTYNFSSVAHISEGETHENHSHEAPSIFEDEQLAFLVDPVLNTDDINRDGFIDYPEFIAATIKKSSTKAAL